MFFAAATASAGRCLDSSRTCASPRLSAYSFSPCPPATDGMASEPCVSSTLITCDLWPDLASISADYLEKGTPAECHGLQIGLSLDDFP